VGRKQRLSEDVKERREYDRLKWGEVLGRARRAIPHPPSAIRHPPSAIRHPPSAIRHALGQRQTAVASSLKQSVHALFVVVDLFIPLLLAHSTQHWLLAWRSTRRPDQGRDQIYNPRGRRPTMNSRWMVGARRTETCSLQPSAGAGRQSQHGHLK
jgi:hypothetical protein